MLKGFRDFILRGNVVDLAVGIVIGAAFTTVVQSFVKDIISPLIEILFVQPDFSRFSFTVHGSRFMLGDFINNIIAFLISASVIYFFVVLPVNKLLARFKGPVQTAPTKQCPECKKEELHIEAIRCPHCTALIGR